MEKFAAREEHRLYDSVVVVILTHGLNNKVFGSDSKPLKLLDFLAILDNENLAGKPKIHFIQACRGGKPLMM